MVFLMVAALMLSGFPALPAIGGPVAATVFAATEIPLKAPAGWKSKVDQGATIMTPSDLEEGKVYTVLVTPLQVKAGPLEEVYTAAKKLVGDVGKYTEATPAQKSQSDGGWDYKVSIGPLEVGDKALLAQVMAVKKGDAGGVVIVLSDSVETLQKYSDLFTDMIRTLGGARKAPPPPEMARPAGVVDLQYSVPKGWTETKKSGVNVVEASNEGFYSKYRWTLVVMPSQALTGTVRDNFKEYWKDLITANYESEVVPLPLMARMSDGYVCAFDGDGSATHKASGARPMRVMVYVIAHGNRFVPMLAILYGYEKQLEEDVDRFIKTARIPNSSNAVIPLFSTKEVTGEWSEGSASIASYVTSSGSYAGDASIYTGGSFSLRSDGTYKHVLIAITSRIRLKETDDGKWRVEGDEIVMSGPKGTNRYSLLGCGNDPKAGRFLVLGPYSNLKAKLSFTNPRGQFQATWYKIK